MHSFAVAPFLRSWSTPFGASLPITSRFAPPLFFPKEADNNFDGCVPARMGSTLLKISFLRTPHESTPCSHLFKGILLPSTFSNPNLYHRLSEIQAPCAITLVSRFCLAVCLCGSPSSLSVCQLESPPKRHECHAHPAPLSRFGRDDVLAERGEAPPDRHDAIAITSGHPRLSTWN